MTQTIPDNAEQLQHKSHLIFDFDGTLVDSFASIIRVFNQLASKHHLRPIELEDISMLKNTDSRTLLRFYKIPIYKIPILAYEAAERIRQILPALQPFSGIPHTIAQLHTAGYQLSIVSSNSEDNVKAWLEHHHLNQYFQYIQHARHYYGKATTLRQILKLTACKKEKICYIGDETRDIEAAKKTGIDCLAVTWGFHSEECLIKYQPQYLVYHPLEILNIFRQRPSLSRTRAQRE